MSGQTGYCVVCGKFQATGHTDCTGIPIKSVYMPAYVTGNFWNLFICESCAPYWPEYRDEKCICCKKGTSILRWKDDEGKDDQVCGSCNAKILARKKKEAELKDNTMIDAYLNMETK